MARIQLLLQWVLLFALAAWAIPIARRELRDPDDGRAEPRPAAWTQDLIDTLANSPAEAELLEQLAAAIASSPAEAEILDELYAADSQSASKLAKRDWVHYGGWVLDHGHWKYDSEQTYKGTRIIGPIPPDAQGVQAIIRRNFDAQNIWEKIKAKWHSVKDYFHSTWNSFKEVASNIWNRFNPWAKKKEDPPVWKSGVPEYDDPNSPYYNRVSPKGSLYPLYGTPGDVDPHQKLISTQPAGVGKDDEYWFVDPNTEAYEKAGEEKPRPLRVLEPIPMTEEEMGESDRRQREAEALDTAMANAIRHRLGLSESGKELALKRVQSYSSSEDDESPSLAAKITEIIKKPFKAVFKNGGTVKHVENAAPGAGADTDTTPSTSPVEEDVRSQPYPLAFAADESPAKLFPLWGTRDEDQLDELDRILIDPDNPFGYFQRPDPFEADLEKQSRIAAENARRMAEEARIARQKAYEARRKAIEKMIIPPYKPKPEAPAEAPAPEKPQEVIIGPKISTAEEKAHEEIASPKISVAEERERQASASPSTIDKGKAPEVIVSHGTVDKAKTPELIVSPPSAQEKSHQASQVSAGHLTSDAFYSAKSSLAGRLAGDSVVETGTAREATVAKEEPRIVIIGPAHPDFGKDSGYGTPDPKKMEAMTR